MPNTPRYRINAVAESTGIPASTLRAWERRYGIPTPSRTSSAYRLYSERDVELVLKLRDLCERGIAPSEAAALLLDQKVQPSEVPPALSSCFDAARSRIIDAIVAFDPAALRVEVARATYLGTAASVFDQVVRPVMVEVGERWIDGSLSVGQEHLASEILMGTVRDLCRLVQPDGADRMALLACFSRELHALPLYGVAFRLASWGIRVEILGGNSPPDAVGDAVRVLRPQLVGLSVTVSPPEEEMASLLDAYADACGACPWMVGGTGSLHARAAIEARGGVVIGSDLTRTQVERAMLMSGPRRSGS